MVIEGTDRPHGRPGDRPQPAGARGGRRGRRGLGLRWPHALDGLVLPVTATPVRASPEGVQAAAAEAGTILSAPLKITGAGAVIEVPVADIAAATTVRPDGADGFTVAVDAAALRSPVMDAINATQAAPADARISIENDAPVITPSEPGRTVDWAATDAAIGPALLAPQREAAIGYVLAEPNLTTEKAQGLGIKEVIGEFTTGGFAAASGENIRVVAEKVNGAIVQPGATFGLNEFTGTRGSAEGYVEAAIIQEGALSTAVGGGISQFATTLYNAAYFAGMGDVTHTPHSFYISRYPPGREATVFDGEIELAFSNDYPTGVLIQTVWTDSDITVRLWGTKHVQVESETTDRFDFTSPQVVVRPYGTSCSPSAGSADSRSSTPGSSRIWPARSCAGRTSPPSTTASRMWCVRRRRSWRRHRRPAGDPGGPRPRPPARAVDTAEPSDRLGG